ncbi:hypothetical protein MBRA_06276 [Methylobacterium brachiatum]|nr:hypothetical protein MBRA_06276 [Methylobacterium brachiatum]
MSPAQWDQIKQDVVERMKAHVRPFITPLGTETPSTVRLVGTGNYVRQEEQRILITCQHVAYTQPIHYRFFGDDSVFEHPGSWRMDPHPIDAAVAALSDQAWNAVPHQAATIPLSRFGPKHQLVEPAELVFLYGFAGENADYGFGVHQTNGSGYCSQEIKNSGDDQIFEVFWEPDKTQYTASTSAEAREAVKFDNPKGLSGSLVWNTRYLEIEQAGGEWTPDDAIVTGLLRRYDPDKKSLLVWRVEHLLAWLCPPPNP